MQAVSCPHASRLPLRPAFERRNNHEKGSSFRKYTNTGYTAYIAHGGHHFSDQSLRFNLRHPGRMPALNGRRASRLGPAVPGGLYARRARQGLASDPNRLGPLAGHGPPLDAPASRASWTSARYHCATICGRRSTFLRLQAVPRHPGRMPALNGQRASRLGPAVPGGLYARRARQRLAPGPNRLGPVAATGLRWTLRPPGPPGRRPGLTVRRSAGGMPRSYGCMRCLGHPGRMPALNGQRASRLGPAVPGGLYARRARQRLAPGPNRLGPVAGHRPPLDAPASRASWTSARYHCATICGRQCHVLTATCRAWHPERLSGRNLSLDDVLSVSRGFLLPPIRTPLEGGVFGCPSWTTGPRRDDDSDVPSEEKK